MKNKNRVITESEKELIEYLASKGTSDGVISKQTGISVAAVGNISTKYWKRKMEEKNG